MLSGHEKNYHVERARAELDLAYRAEDSTAAAAHMKLSALHMKQVKQIDEVCSGSGIRSER